MKKTFTTKLVGITQIDNDGTDRQEVIENYVLENYDSNTFDKEDRNYYTNAEIKEDGYEVYQYWLAEKKTIKLVPEPENPHDPNAIMVVHDKMGKIGYIPRTDNVELAKFLEDCNNDVKITINLDGGPYKIYDDDQEKIIRKNDKPFYFKIYIKAKKTKDKNKPVNPTRYLIFAAISLILAITYIVEKYIPLTIIFLYLLYRNIKKYKDLKNNTKTLTPSENNENNK